MNRMKNVLAVTSMGAAALFGASANAASLFGDNIDVTLDGSIVLEDFGVLVGPGVELQGGDISTNWGAFLFPSESIDIGEDTISMAFDTSLGEFAVLTFSDLDFGAGIGGVSLVSTIPAVTAANLSFTDTSITLDLADWFAVGGPGTLELTLSEVPVPGAVWLMGGALAGLGFMRRR